MLPTETVTEVFSFLGYYDLGGLKQTNKTLSTVAHQCAYAIRILDFSDFDFYIRDSRITVYRYALHGSRSLVCRLDLSSEKNLAEFVSDAFRNCTFGQVTLARSCEDALNALKV